MTELMEVPIWVFAIMVLLSILGVAVLITLVIQPFVWLSEIRDKAEQLNDGQDDIIEILEKIEKRKS